MASYYTQRQKKILWGERKCTKYEKENTHISLECLSCSQHMEGKVTAHSAFGLFIPYNLAVFASQMKLKYVTALNTFYKLQWNLQLKRLYDLIPNGINIVISWHISQGLCGNRKKREKQQKLSIAPSKALEYGTTDQ